MQKDEIRALLVKHNITVESVFVPWSMSRKSGEKNPSLNWKVTLKCDDRIILSTDYTAGCAHCPSYSYVKPDKIWGNRVLAWECENGRELGKSDLRHLETFQSLPTYASPKRKPILPDSVDVVYSLLIDSDVLCYSSFEDWASNFGYDPDSRSAERTYNECMKIALKFNQLGPTVISELKESYRDY